MPCHAMHPIQDLFLESFSYILQIDKHFICTPMWTKKNILVKSGCYSNAPNTSQWLCLGPSAAVCHREKASKGLLALIKR
jgi:hypothetical protein